MNMLRIYQLYIRTYSMILKMLYSLCKSSVSSGFAKVMPDLFNLGYNGSIVTWTVVSLTAAKFQPLIFSVSGLALSYPTNIVVMILYVLCLLPAQFFHIIVYVRKVESHVEIADRCAFWTISNDVEKVVP
jgi:hypothetical protein